MKNKNHIKVRCSSLPKHILMHTYIKSIQLWFAQTYFFARVNFRLRKEKKQVEYIDIIEYSMMRILSISKSFIAFMLYV